MQVTQASAPNPTKKVFLTSEQTDRLKRVLDHPIPICSSPPSSCPTLNLVPRHFLRQVLCKLKEHSIDIIGIRLNGGGASYVLVTDVNFVYRDIDILFLIQTPLSQQRQTTLFSSNNQPYACDVWTLIKFIVCSCLLEHISHATSSEHRNYTPHYLSTVLDTYAKKNIKIASEHDSWALLSLQNFAGQNLELKFVEHLKRQWQFSVDSFQINLEPLLYEKRVNHRHPTASHACQCPSISSITKTIKTKSLIIDAINGLTIIKNSCTDEQTSETKTSQDKATAPIHSASPLEFGFFTPSSSPTTTQHASTIEFQTLATITTIATSKNKHAVLDSRSRSSKESVSTLNDDSNDSSLQFHLSLNDDIDDGIVSDADDSAVEDDDNNNDDDDQVFRTPVNANSAPSSPATIVSIDLPSPSLQIEVHSVYNDLHQALDHLKKKLIATYTPETMRGGGLLKYCDLLAQNYKVYDLADMCRMQRYMCSRFFIDYKTVPEQIHVITQYVTTHFLPLSMSSLVDPGQPLMECRMPPSAPPSSHSKSSLVQHTEHNHLVNARLCLLFFDHLLSVIQQSTVCLTHHDKEMTLIHINNLKESYHYKYEHLFLGDHQHFQQYHMYHHHHHHQQQQQYHHHCSSSSSNSSRSSSPSSSSSNSYRYYRQTSNANNHRQHYYRPHHLQRPSSNASSSYYHGSRNYSNDFNSNPTSSMSNHHRFRRQQS